jgi:O-antigen ligase
MTKNLQKWLGVSGGLLFILINCWGLYRGYDFIPLISLALVGLYLLFFKLDILMYLMAFVVPLSIPFENKQVSVGLSFPSEIIMVLITGLFFIRIFLDLKMDRKVMTHPVTITILLYLGWMLFTCFTSEIPLVSFKFFLSTVWFIVPCYFMLTWLVKEDIFKWVKFMNFYMAGLAIVICIATGKLALAGFPDKGVHWIMSPYYNDHTAYGAAIALLIPLQIGFFFLPNRPSYMKLLYTASVCLLFIGLFFSFCRAAWLSLIGVIGVFIALKLRIKMSWIILGVGLIAFTFYSFSDEILYRMGRNSQDSSSSFAEHIRSISNISTDASNVERINRWVSAFGMIEERPWVGWGPGTYQFIYATFQKPTYKTIITTNFGDGGNAHSEFIGPTAETGFIGLATVLAVMIATLYTGIRTYISARRKDLKIISLAASLALISYYLHGIMNNFLDTDKLSLPFWACVAVIVVIDLINKKETQALTNCDTTDGCDRAIAP